MKFVFRNIISQFQREETQLFVLRVMVGLVILYDHVHPNGAFVKAANVDVSLLNFCMLLCLSYHWLFCNLWRVVCG